MTVNDTKPSTNNVRREQLQIAYDHFQEEGDYASAEKIIDLYEKEVKDEFIITFTGHFSAGKSSIINYLLNKEVLPKSPIPTSANIVKVKSGEGVARFHFKDAVSLEYDEPYDIDMVKEYAKDKDTIKQIEISTSEAILPANSVLMDTPGIDAADDADRLMTESALHTIDELYYVMDYNHVQSEVNMLFLKEMKEQEVPVHIIINQIDKHNEAELSFDDFQKTVKQTFDQWKVRPKSIYYTSAYALDTVHNDLEQLKKDIFLKLEKRENNHQRFQAAIDQIMKEHSLYLKDHYELLADDVLDDFSNETVSEVTNIQDELNRLDAIEPSVYDAFMEEVQTTLKNAYIMPAKLRDLAEIYLQAEAKDFKIGFFQSKKKTEAERNARLDNFLTSLNETMNATIVWKLREKFNELMHEYHLQDSKLQDEIEQFAIDYQESNVRQFMKNGATVNGNYVLNYTNEISNDIKSKFRSLANNLWKTFQEVIIKHTQERKSDLQGQLESMQVNETVITKRNDLNKILEEKIENLQDLFNKAHNNVSLDTLHALVEERKQIEKADVINAIPRIEKEETELKAEQTNESSSDIPVETITKMIDHITATIEDTDGFKHFIEDLQTKKAKLENRQLTIALFGAFSAGKSSFANAMLANRVLPVSPNPTTAVINRIHPVNHKHTHGEIVLHFKDEKELYEDLIRITSDFSPTARSLDDLIDWIQIHHIQHHKQLNNMYQSYLKAILAGYDTNKQHLNNQLTITLDQFADFVTDESKACYLELVDLYYDCPLTQKGITLVDTPGADSVNARHTNVSFDYIKEADAILYVTYYNHAVTSADRDFLMQLGRVKEAFELDKMFFIVNAADLAQTEEDLQLVLEYVDDQLLKLGIRQAKIYPLSSKLSLEEKIAEETVNDKMQAFEKQFYQFIEQDLAALTIESARWDIKRLQQSLKQLIEAASLPDKEKLAYKKQLEKQKEQYDTFLNNVELQRSITRINERIERQLHFVLERLYIRFHDMFSEYFNPTTITASGKEGQEQLAKQRNDFIHYVGYELLQEVRAVSLRLEAYMNELLQEEHVTIQQKVTEVDKHFLLSQLDRKAFETAIYEEAFTNISYDDFTKAMKVFRNVKRFFENNDREKMKDLFYEALQPEAANYIDQIEREMKDHYKQQWIDGVESLQNDIANEVKDHMSHQLQVVNDEINVTALQSQLTIIDEQLQNIV